MNLCRIASTMLALSALVVGDWGVRLVAASIIILTMGEIWLVATSIDDVRKLIKMYESIKDKNMEWTNTEKSPWEGK